ncbi:hypothetical protein CEXT_90301 [Caerostris extrusa]|uniref:Uncharacterized protein n=1 Tax=Caerostris extrusa TaxID=172846 RepID=A0AAV4NUF2_CAEEX|nr:hypothetical protein CEXT_90301 [Caerostris extrusa]
MCSSVIEHIQKEDYPKSSSERALDLGVVANDSSADMTMAEDLLTTSADGRLLNSYLTTDRDKRLIIWKKTQAERRLPKDLFRARMRSGSCGEGLFSRHDTMAENLIASADGRIFHSYLTADKGKRLLIWMKYTTENPSDRNRFQAKSSESIVTNKRTLKFNQTLRQNTYSIVTGNQKEDYLKPFDTGIRFETCELIFPRYTTENPSAKNRFQAKSLQSIVTNKRPLNLIKPFRKTRTRVTGHKKGQKEDYLKPFDTGIRFETCGKLLHSRHDKWERWAFIRFGVTRKRLLIRKEELHVERLLLFCVG